jgi:mono/diheme cytochrome c family protein
MLRSLLIACALAWLALPGGAPAAEPVAGPAPLHGPFLAKHCGDCHGGDAAEGGFRVGMLVGDFDSPAVAAHWGRAIMRLETGEMPPAESPRPDAAELRQVLLEAKRALAAAAARHRPAGRARIRRLNRLEYENTIRDLLGIDAAFQSILPEDDLAEGFSTGADALTISPVHIQQYMAAADRAIEEATVRQQRPETRAHRFSYAADAEKGFNDYFFNTMLCNIRGEDLLFFGPTHIEVPAFLRQLETATREAPGRYHVRITAEASDTKDGGSLVYSVWLAAGGIRRRLIGHFDAASGGPITVEFTLPFGRGESLIVAPYDMARVRTDAGYSIYLPDKGERIPKGWHWVNNRNPPIPAAGPALVIKPLEITGPLLESWPPAGHLLLYGDAPLVPAAEVAKQAAVPAAILRPQRGYLTLPDPLTLLPPAGEAEGRVAPVLAEFMARAYRRPVTADEVEPFAAMARQRLAAGDCFEVAMNAAHRAVLCSPDFLLLVEDGPVLGPHALAARLSYFLTRSSPDAPLRQRADRGDLGTPEAVRAEADRLLSGPRADAFVADFLDHWLSLRDIEATTPDRDLFPEYFTDIFSGTQDSLLHESLVKETRAFFRHLIDEDLGVTQLVDSRTAFLNSRLAAHYDLPAVEGVALRPVPLPDDSLRGGLLTQGSVLKVTANGASTSPVIRGVWLLGRILGTPPPPPPPDAGSLEPDTRGATTIREQLAKHARDSSCATCHRKIDPPGFALEAFDPIGRERTFYRSTGTGEKLDKLRVFQGAGYGAPKYLKGLPVDAAARLPDGTSIADIRGYKAHLARDPAALARNLVRQLATFATGRPVEPGDLLEVDRIVERAAADGHGVRSLIRELVASRLFREK